MQIKHWSYCHYNHVLETEKNLNLLLIEKRNNQDCVGSLIFFPPETFFERNIKFSERFFSPLADVCSTHKPLVDSNMFSSLWIRLYTARSHLLKETP